jgi:hypothetical protein
MSEPELAYMTTTNEDFDLPRWQTHAHLEPLSSSAQAAQAAARASYLYPSAPLPPPPQSLTNLAQRLPPLHQSPGSSRQPRLAHILDHDQPTVVTSSSFLSSSLNQLSRSASLGGGGAGNGSSRARRHHHQPEDLEGAFNVDTQNVNSSRHMAATPNSLYPSGVAFHQTQSLPGPPPPNNSASPTGVPNEPYSEMYYNGSSGNIPKRAHTQHDPTSRSGRSPMRAVLDPYSQQAQYSPSTTPYLYGSSPDVQRNSTSSVYQTHARNSSQTKVEVTTPPISSPYTPQSAAQAAYAAYAMDSSSPAPSQNQTHLSAQTPIKSSISTPNTPLSFAHPQSPANQFYQQDQPMIVDQPQHRRRASGFKRVRDPRDLRPYVNPQPSGRRMDGNGVFLSVRILFT